MKSQRSALGNILIALVVLPACAGGEGAPVTSGSGGHPAGTAGMSGGTGDTGLGGTVGNGGGNTAGDSGGAGRGGSVPATGGSAGGGSGGMGAGTGGAVTGTGGAAIGGKGGTTSGSGGSLAGAGGGPSGGTTGGLAGGGGKRAPVQIASSVPSQYGNPVANPGKWTAKTYPAYYYTTSSSGSPDQTLPKQSTPIMKPLNVYTPPDYDPQVQYPLIFVFHGITDNQNTWMERGKPKPNVLLDNLITSKVIQPVIAVFPQGDASQAWASHSSFGDTAGYFVFGDDLMNDIVPYIEANYSVRKDRNSRAISGFSMGGMQTVNIGLSHHLKDFGWFGAYAPAGGAYSSTQIASYLQKQDVASYPVNYFYAMAGNNDGFSTFDTVNAYGKELPGDTSAITSANFTTHVISGAHDYPTASVGLYNFLRIAFGN
jgi:hypothetical protein